MAAEPRSPAAPPAAPTAGQQAEEPAGAEFFRRRLQRAMAIPPEQRDPAVHAFVTSVQLMEAADELLPLTADGQPALPADTFAGQEAEVQAMLLAATARHLAVIIGEWEGRPQNRLARYLLRRVSGARQAGRSWQTTYPPALQPLGQLLMSYFFAHWCTDEGPLPTCRLALATLAGSRGTVQRQLQQFRHSALPKPSAEQLEAALLLQVVQLELQQLLHMIEPLVKRCVPPQQALPGVDLHAAIEETAIDCRRLAAHAPCNPGAVLAAADGAIAGSQLSAAIARLSHQPDRGRAFQLRQWGMDQQLHALRAAQAQRSAFWTATVSYAILILGLKPFVAISEADLAAVIAAAEQAPAAMRRLRGLLPQSWLAHVQRTAAPAAAMLPAARVRLQAGNDAEAHRQAFESARTALDEANPRDSCACSGCGQRALGLRRCSRCKQAAYCSRECQMRHWPQHKRECKAPSSSGGG